MALLVTELTATTAWATTIDGVSYIDENGVAQTANGVTVLEGGGATTLSAGWYVVNSKIDYTGTVTLSGNISSSDYKAKLDGKTLTPINDPSGAREFTMVFDDVAGISEELRVKSEEFATATDWYTLDGRRFSGKPTKSGVYVKGGKKFIIK